MKLVRSLTEIGMELTRGAVSIGNFDGVHQGHARIIQELCSQAARVGGPAVVFTFDPHPVRLLRPAETPPPLTWTDRKADLLAELGCDALVAYPTDEGLLALSPREFLDRIIRQRLGAQAIVEGANFQFGRGRAGTIEVLRALANESGMTLSVVDPVILDGEPVSSSRVRQLIAAGDVDAARRLLTRPYRLRGMVTHGVGRGVKIGFPTANVGAVDTILPGVGVYAGTAWWQGRRWPAAVNVGPNPTFGEATHKIEVHLIGFSGSLYGQPLEVDFLTRLRDIRPFSGPEALRAQLEEDVARARAVTLPTFDPHPVVPPHVD
jgi:riboflavin kinase/FMN adenylyltransferase